MDYKSADEKLQGRCQQSRKMGNNTYLHRDGGDSISLRLHSTDVVTWYRNGDIKLNTGGWNTVTTRDRINEYSPWRVTSEREQLFLIIGGWENGKRYPFDCRVTIKADGTVEGADDLAEIEAQWKEQDRERARQSRWLAKARGFKRTHSCGKARRQCDALRGRGFGAQLFATGEFECGCVVERVTHKTKLTVAEIMAESNITVRMAMVHVYGLERFLIDANAKTIDTHGEYSLLDMPMGEGWNIQHIRALKMTCPSTGVVYISPVAPHVRNVADALDWYFQTKDYLASVTQQS